MLRFENNFRYPKTSIKRISSVALYVSAVNLKVRGERCMGNTGILLLKLREPKNVL